MVRKPSPAVYRSEELNALLESLEPDNNIRRWIEDMEGVLMENMFAGDRIQKNRIPRYYRDRYGVNNLFHYTHPEGYRSCYALILYEDRTVCPLIIDILPHPEYERRFGYR